jgi:excisionase family DNA binding protein
MSAHASAIGDISRALPPGADTGDSRRPVGLLDWEGAADRLGVTPRHVRKLWSERRIAGVHVGRFVRFRTEDIDAFIESHRTEAIR